MSVSCLHRSASLWTVIPGLICSILLTASLVACDGSDGRDGAPGKAGASASIDIRSAKSINPSITSASVSSPPVVEFLLRNNNGNGIVNLPASSIRFTIAKLMPGTDGNSNAWQSYFNELDDGAVQATREAGSSGNLVDHGDGRYTYTFATDITRIENPVAVPFNGNLTHRVSFEIRGFVPVDNPVYDFRPGDGATNGLFSREIVKTATCNRCHERLAQHEGTRFEMKQCVSCHNPGSSDGQSGNTVDFRVMVHKIHMGVQLPSVIAGQDYCIQGSSLQCYGDVVFPQDVRNCKNCHDADDPETPDAASWYFKPTAEACGSCHDNVNFMTGEGHAEVEPGAGIVADNSLCAGCHAASPLSPIEVRQAHRMREQEAVAQFQFNLDDISFGGLGTAPVVDFSITNPVNNSMPYDLANDPEITRSNLRFTLAWNTLDYFNEGSGSNPAQPATTVLISDGALSPDAIDNSDGTYTLALNSIPNGTSIPITGSGAVTLEGHPVIDIGAAEVEVPATSAVAYFGITDDPENPTPRRKKVEINRCNNCHEHLSAHGNNRNGNLAVCASCHNPNATDVNHRPADPNTTPDGKAEESIDLKYLIHKIHAADIVIYSDGGSVNDFTQVHYPQRLSNCTACHTDTGYYPVASGAGGVLATTISTGVDSASPLDDINISPNAAACYSCHTASYAKLHMEQSGGSFDACQQADGTLSMRVDACGATPGPTIFETCIVCHSPGRTADVAVVHEVD